MENLQEKITEMLTESKMNWEVNKEPLQLADGTAVPFNGIVRSDTRKCFGTCTDKYEVFQNNEMMELAHRVTEATGYKFNTKDTRVYHEGARLSLDLYAKDKTLEYKKVGDVVRNGLRITNSHDGSGSLRLALFQLVLSCTNGMTHWVQNRATSIRHTANMRDMVDAALKGFEIIKQEEETLMAEIEKMIAVPVDSKDVAGMVKRILDVDVNKVSAQYTSDDYSSRKLNQVKSLMESIKEEMDYKDQSVWGLFNGVTHYTTHKAGSDKHREASKVFGTLKDFDRYAWDYALALVN